jgi:outer membrane protein assembly factor BamD (BamD/ComL family)
VPHLNIKTNNKPKHQPNNQTTINPSTKQVKEELTAAMGLNTEADGSVAAFLRKGVKNSTWFEDDASLEQSREWRL